MFDVPVIQAGASGAACITFEGRNARADPEEGRDEQHETANPIQCHL